MRPSSSPSGASSVSYTCPASTRSTLANSGPRLTRIREEQLLAVDPVGSDRVLSFGRDHPIHDKLTELLFDARVLVRVHQHHAVLVEQAFVAFDEQGEVAAVLEGQPRA